MHFLLVTVQKCWSIYQKDYVNLNSTTCLPQQKSSFLKEVGFLGKEEEELEDPKSLI